MEHRSLDPYEQQLLKVFNTYDHDNLGSLDRDGLTQLCHTLQLEEQSGELIKSLLKDPKTSRATFMEFKDALLALLGSMQNGKLNDETDKCSPDREVSPKYVYGSKKYGRKSRPKGDDSIVIANIKEEKSSCEVSANYTTSVQRSNSQSDVSYSKKRKTNYALKRCTSFPGRYDYRLDRKNELDLSAANNLKNGDHDFLCTEDMLREAWNKLGVGHDGYLNQRELILVCDAIGLHELAKGVINQLSNRSALNYDDKISFQELLEILQQDETWSEILNPPLSEANESLDDLNATLATDESVFPSSPAVQYVMFGPDGVGTVNTNVIVEMWENAGITSPKLLLHDLGFTAAQINVVELASILEKEIKGINDVNRSDFSNPHVALLQATLTLYQSEILCLKTILEQMHAEREKLKCDVVEANNRATLLAQEVDDNHAKMEQNTQNQVRLIEQRHADILKDITNQLSFEKEQLSTVNSKLEQKIRCLEGEEVKLKNDLMVAQNYSMTLERENQMLMSQVSELRQAKNSLSEQIGALESEKQKYNEKEIEQIEPLLAKLAALQVENSQLRDKNDEMMSEIECLTNEVTTARMKISSTPTFNTLDRSMEENISVICEGVGIGAKRRNDESPSKEIACGLGDGSPRLGKIRKFHKKREPCDASPFVSGESGVDADLEGFDSSSASISGSEAEEMARLQARISRLECILLQHSIPFPIANDTDASGDKDAQIAAQQRRCEELEKLFAEAKGVLMDRPEISGAATKEQKSVATDTDEDANFGGKNIEERMREYEAANKALTAKCDDLEMCIDLMKTEYDRCEDYWSSKLEEERQIFESEQAQSGEKLAELINKMTEYEEQFAVQDGSQLPPIEEKYNLEKQFTDLEQEYDRFRESSEQELGEKNQQITLLSQKLTELSVRKNQSDAAVQVENLATTLLKSGSLSNHLVETTNLFPADTMPFGWNINTPSTQNALEKSTNSQSPFWGKEPEKPSQSDATQSDMSSTFSLPNSEAPSPSTSTITTATTNSNNASDPDLSTNAPPPPPPCRPKRTRKFDRNTFLTQKLYKKNNYAVERKADETGRSSSDGKYAGEQQCVLPISTIHNLNAKLGHLEHRCRHLQLVLKQQHYNAEQMLQYCWQQHRGEKAELQYMLKTNQEKLDAQIRICNEQLERLAKTDILVKDLYVENAYLIANVQRLEQQCYVLAQCNSNTGSF